MIVCVTSGKGGPGATVLAVNLAVAFSETGRNCLLLDLDPSGGDIGVYLDPDRLDPRRGLLPLLKLERGDVTKDSIGRESQAIGGGLWVLLGLVRPAPDLLGGRIANLIETARELADVVVVDLGRAVPGSPSLEACTFADRVMVAACADLQGALAAERALTLIPRATEVVATKVSTRRSADVVELAEALGRPIATSIPLLKSPVSSRRGRRVRRELSRLVAQPPPIEKTAAPALEDLKEVII
jgi:Mrp family chromosome partitioning ATPase